jgi:hypothetical protein
MLNTLQSNDNPPKKPSGDNENEIQEMFVDEISNN